MFFICRFACFGFPLVQGILFSVEPDFFFFSFVKAMKIAKKERDLRIEFLFY